MKRTTSKRRRGFTLIEMIVVVAIVGILASAAMPLAALHKRRMQEAELRQSLRVIRTALDDYKRAWELGRIEKKIEDSGYPPDLETLVKGIPDISSPKARNIYFLRRIPRDPFAVTTLPSTETWGLRSYGSPPNAPQAGRDVFDVYSHSTGTGMDGTAYRDW